jgi:hypothetical protein
MAEILEHPWMKCPTPGIIIHPSPSVADLARPFTSIHIEEEILESLHVVCGKQMSFEQLTAELCSPPGQGEFAKAFYYLLDQHRRFTLLENGMCIGGNLDDPYAKRISKQYSRPVSRTTSRANSTIEVERFRPSSKLPPTGPLPATPEQRSSVNRTRGTSPAGPRQAPSRRATSPAGDLRDVPLLCPPAHASATPPHMRRSGLPTPSRPRSPQRARTYPAARGVSPAPSEHSYQGPTYSPALADSPRMIGSPLATPSSRLAGLPSPQRTEHAFFQPNAIQRPHAVRPGAPGAHPLFAAPRVQDAALQTSIDAIANRMNVLASGQDSYGAHVRAATEYGAPLGKAVNYQEVPRRRAETAGPKGGDKENAGYQVDVEMKDAKSIDIKRKGRRKLDHPFDQRTY